MLEQLWPIFLAEVGEKLDAAEALVTEAAAQNASQESATDVDALFREFHTIKSNLSMVDFKEPMEIANACEDILHGLRKSKTVPHREILQALLESVDWIKQQVADAAPGQYPRATNDALHKKLAPFRQQDEAPPPEPTEIPPQEIGEQKTHDLTVEKEALEIDTLRISSNSLDELVTQITQLILIEHQIDSLSASKDIAQNINALQKNLQKDCIDNYNSLYQEFETILQTFSDNKQALLNIDTQIRAINDNIQSGMLALRTIPLSTIFTRLPRVVRQKASSLGKQVQLVTDGGEVSIDKSMLDVISEPLIHLLHNAINHGIESPEERKENNKPEMGKISITASKIGELIQLDIQDDGHGIDYTVIREKVLSKSLCDVAALDSKNRENAAFWLNFLFSHGFNSDIPNRTTGLDVVRDHLLRIGGSIQITSTPQVGTQFIVRIPKTVAIQNTLLVQASKQYFAIPSRHVMEILDIAPNELQENHGVNMLNLRGQSLPVYSLNHLLKLPASHTQHTQKYLLVILQHEEDCIALHVDDALGRQDLFLRHTHQDLRNIPGISGVSLLGNGRAIIILDCEGLFRLTSHYAESRHAAH